LPATKERNRQRSGTDPRKKVGVTGIEHIVDSSGNQSLSEVRAANSGAVSLDSSATDPLLALVMANWSKLSGADQVAIVAIVQATTERSAIE
jgi:hypothetical protein